MNANPWATKHTDVSRVGRDVNGDGSLGTLPKPSPYALTTKRALAAISLLGLFPRDENLQPRPPETALGYLGGQR